MMFSDTTSKQGLIQDVDFLCGSTSASYAVADKTRNINVAYNSVSRLIWDAADDWQYDDSNATDLPKVLRTMGHASASYQVPSTSQRIERVEAKSSDGNWRKLIPIDYRDITVSLDEYHETAGMPIYYDLVGNYLTLYPAPSSAYATLSSGLTLRVSRDVTEFPTTATTTSPGFAKQFHRILSISASMDYLGVVDQSQVRLLAQMKDGIEKAIKQFYSSRQAESRTQVRPYGKRRWRQYQ